MKNVKYSHYAYRQRWIHKHDAKDEANFLIKTERFNNLQREKVKKYLLTFSPNQSKLL